MNPNRLPSSPTSMRPLTGARPAPSACPGDTRPEPISTGEVLPFRLNHFDAASTMPATRAKKVRILGIRGIPAAHGGFETFTEYLALYLVKHGWDVTVYCQEDGDGEVCEDIWHGIRRVRIPVATPGVAGTIVFDWRSTLHAIQETGVALTLGYNTAVFCALYRLKGLPNVISMDGIEWRRQKWGKLAKVWFWLNDWLGCWLGNHLIADHPEIKHHLETRVDGKKISTIAYGADAITTADTSVLQRYGLEAGKYAVLIARPEPENSILEVVKAWSQQHRGTPLVVLGKYEDGQAYQDSVIAAASSEVLFLGAIYDKPVVEALRFFARFYIHGHQVGGTNPSLVESLGSGNAILAHDNRFNRGVSGEGGLYFSGEDECAEMIGLLLNDGVLVDRLQAASRLRHQDRFTWDKVLKAYETLLEEWIDVPEARASIQSAARLRESSREPSPPIWDATSTRRASID